MNYRIEQFDRIDNQDSLGSYIQQTVLPYYKNLGFNAYLFSTQYSLGLREMWLVTSMERLNMVTLIGEKFFDDKEGKDIERNLVSKTVDSMSTTVKDLEPEIKWIRIPGKMYHVENFNSLVGCEAFEKFFLREAFPYLRKRGFNIKLFRTLQGYRPADYWFITEMDRFASIDNWSKLASGEPEGEKIMQKFMLYTSIPKASVIKEVQNDQ